MNTEIKKEKKICRGSEWKKWDLHAHSDSSPGLPEQIVNKMIEEGISAFSITDHNSVESVDEFLEIVKRKQQESKEIYFFPGVELKTDKGKRPVHLIGIFPLEDGKGVQINSDYLKQNLLSKIDCSDADIIKAGKDALGGGKKLDDYRKRGLLEITVPFEKAAKRIKDLRGITIVHAGTKSRGIEKEMRHAKSSDVTELYNSLGHTKRILMEEYIDICELSNWNESSLKERDFYLKRFDKPSIVSSDAHRLSDIGLKYTWIKADLTFEGLKQIIYEPKERVYIGDDDPRRFAHSWLESFEVEDDSSKQFFIRQNNPIHFSPGLNVLIGARGSGKSVFHDSLALSLDQSGVNPDSYVSNFLIKNKKSTLVCCVTTKGGSIGRLVKYKWEGEKQTERFPCDYFFQKKIGKIAEGRTAEEKNALSKFIFEHIFAEVAKNTLETIEDAKEGALLKLKRNGNDINSQENLINKEVDVNKGLIDFGKQLDSYSQEELRGLYDKRAQIIELQNTLKENIDGLAAKMSEYKDFLERLDILSIKEAEKILKVDFISKKLKRDFKREFSGIVARMEVSIKTPLSALKEARGLLESFKRKLRLDQEYKKIEKEICEKSEELDIEFNEELDSKIRKIQGKITKLEGEQRKIVKAKGLKKKLIKKREGLLKNYLEQLSKTEKLLEGAFELFCKQDGKVLGDSIRIDFYKDRNVEDYIKAIEDYKKLSDAEPSGGFPRSKLQKIFEKEQNIQKVISKFRKRNFDSWEEIEGVGEETTSYLEAIENIEQIAMLLEENLPSLNVTIQWKDQKGDYKPLSECSVGERSTAVLSIILASGKTPLLIDQPEDDLDNFYIFDRLIPIIKTVKERRQLIFATHDANIVVNADAELILILKSPDGKRAEMEPATIENMEKREDVITILEGGAEAFARREKKLKSR